jgi:Domain of unknown function (DUF6265)
VSDGRDGRFTINVEPGETMRRTTLRASLVVTVFALVYIVAPVLAAEDAPKAKIGDLAWMTGHWSGPMQNGTLEENWIQPTAKSLASLVRATSGDATSMIELIVIEEENDTLMLRLQQWNPGFKPRTPAPQVMKLVSAEPNKVVFGATVEGELKTLGYSRPAPDQFVISIETAQGAKFDIPLTRKAEA